MKELMRLAVAGLLLAAGNALANNLAVTNTAVVTYQPDAGLAKIRFDIAWENSWRYTNVNHDAAWVFFKVRPEGTTNWTHVKLVGTGTNPAGYATGSGTGIEFIVPDDGVGVFVRRAAEGQGTVSVTNAYVVWNFATNTWSKTLKVQVQTLAIEMVYVAGGAFWAGNTNAIINSSFHAQGNTNSPVYIASDDPFTIYWGPSDANSATISNAFPKGYNAFYCMKYEITQGQYTDFLNLLPASQAANRYSSASTGSGYTIGTNTMGAYTNGAADRACNFTSWADEAAFADWSGLRPMTELEFEKACRGPVMPVMNEYAWGSANIWKQTGHSGTVGSGTETALPANANCNGGGGIGTPVRVGIYATGSSSRESAGASYWGIMELSGNLWERLVSVGLAKGRTFTGLMGDGTLSASGDADVLNWPPSNGDGHGWRGAYWNTTVPSTVFCVSDRVNAALGSSWGSRYNESGFRGVRTASSGVGP